MKLSFVFLYFFFSEMTSLLQTQNGEFKSRNYKMKNYLFVWYNNDTREVDAFWGKLRGVIYNNKLGHVWVIICCKNISKNIFLFLRSIKMAVEKKACNCLLLKVNQIGSVTESIEA